MRLTELTVYYISILTIPAASVGSQRDPHRPLGEQQSSLVGRAALYCVPTLFRFFKNLSNPAQRAAQPADDTVYVCHDEAFLQPKA